MEMEADPWANYQPSNLQMASARQSDLRFSRIEDKNSLCGQVVPGQSNAIQEAVGFRPV